MLLALLIPKKVTTESIIFHQSYLALCYSLKNAPWLIHIANSDTRLYQLVGFLAFGRNLQLWSIFSLFHPLLNQKIIETWFITFIAFYTLTYLSVVIMKGREEKSWKRFIGNKAEETGELIWVLLTSRKIRWEHFHWVS